MKAFIALFALATVRAEADPQLIVNAPLAYNYATAPVVASSPILKSVVAPYTYKTVSADKKKVVEIEGKPITYAHPAVATVPYTTTPVVSSPAVAYTHGVHAPIAYTHGTPLTYATVPQTNVFVEQAPKYVAKNGEVEHKVYRRDAEADPALFYAGAYNTGVYNGVYNTPYMTPYTTPLAYSPYTAAAPVVSHPAAVTYAAHPYVVPAPVSGIKTYANDAAKPQNYAGKGQYAAVSAGAIHIAKRDAEADPALFYSNYHGYPYTTAAAHVASPYVAASPVVSTPYVSSPYVSSAYTTTPYVSSPYYGGLYNYAF